MKRALSAVSAVLILISIFTSCEKSTENGNLHTFYFKDSFKSSEALAVFFNSKNGKSKKVKMKKIKDNKNYRTFSCKGDTSKYNMAYIKYGSKKTDKFAFNKCVSGWWKTENNFIPYTQGEKFEYSPKFDDLTLNYKGYTKIVHVWKPKDYGEKAGEKYSTVYVLDAHIMTLAGQEITGKSKNDLGGCPNVTQQVNSMISSTGKKAIVVAVENIVGRDNELVPKFAKSRDVERFGESEYDSMDGSMFSEFFSDKLVPYIQKNYSVYKDSKNTSLTGASLGGLEAFYIAMENPGIFGTVGAFSPSFWEFKNEDWDKYISEKSINSKSPFVYFYTGPEKADTGAETKEMYNCLKKSGYPKDKLVLEFNKEGAHNAYCWRSYFSEFLTAAAFKKIEPLQN